MILRRNAIFDLDGTLVDSLPGIEQSTRFAITKILPDESLPNLKTVIGPPIAMMFKLLWPDLPSEKVDSLVAVFRSHYLVEGCLKSTPFPSVPTTLARLQAADLGLFVLTNKPSAPTRRILEYLGLAHFFTASLSQDSVEPPFRMKADGARMLMDKFGLKAEETTLIGDGVDDAAAAQACGFRFIAAAYGYGTAADGAQLRVKKFSEIESLLL